MKKKDIITKKKRLNPDGSEILDTTPVAIPLNRRIGMSADQKLKQMLQAEIARAKEPDETYLDSYDFDLPDDSPKVHSTVEVNPSHKRDIIEAVKSYSKKKSTDGEEPAVSKPAKTGRASRVVKDESTESASEGSSHESEADSEDES